MEEQKGSGYVVENILLMKSNFNREVTILFNDGTPISNQVHIEKKFQDTTDGTNRFVVGLLLTFKAIQNEKVVYQIETEMIGVFEKKADSPLPIETFKEVNAPAIIYPFIREHVASITLKAGIGNVLLPSVNFKV